jgi:RND family efflux transporter MFP subunit
MTSPFRLLGRLAVTLFAVAVAAIVFSQLWGYYMDAPWTRDARVRADVVTITPDVSGLVSAVLVHDNETVRKGQVLFRIDPERFRLALRLAEASVQGQRAALEEAVREQNRYDALTDLSVSREKREQLATAVRQSAAAYAQAIADRDLAQLNLQRAEVVAPVNGTITNLDLRPGDYVSVGKAAFALVDSDSFHVDGYFEETKLDRIHVGDPVRIHLMGQPGTLRGTVESIATAIADSERSNSANLLADVNPTFTWVRLAQRVPVRIRLGQVPAQVGLVAGRTATVYVGDAARGPLGLFGRG